MLDALAILLSGVATYFTRVLFLVTKKVRAPKRALRFLPLVGPAVLGAIAVPGLLAPRGEISLVATVPAIVAAIVATRLWRWRRQMVVGLVGGLIVWWGIVFALVQFGLR